MRMSRSVTLLPAAGQRKGLLRASSPLAQSMTILRQIAVRRAAASLELSWMRAPGSSSPGAWWKGPNWCRRYELEYPYKKHTLGLS